MTTLPRLTLALEDEASLRALFEQQLSKGRAFVPGAAGVEPLQACTLVLTLGDRTHALDAEAVFVKSEAPGLGVGLQLAPLDADRAAALQRFVHRAEGPDADAGDPPEALPVEPTQDDAREGEGVEDADRASPALSLQERIRGLSMVEQQRLASTGSLPERVALERAFGPHVWEALLGNPRLTLPEVARIARKGTLPRPLVETIASHASWLAAPEVQRALLGNPRATPLVVSKALGAMARVDLLLVPQQTAYPASVRMQARRLLGK